jgi:hypothetical protein
MPSSDLEVTDDKQSRAFQVQPVYRYLRGYCLDPGFSTRLDTAEINESIYRVPFEKLRPGPCGEYIAVIDVDPASDCCYEPVDLSEEVVASQQGLAPSEGNPQFHQQFVYAVAMKTIAHFERALGRKLLWSPRVIRPEGAALSDRARDEGWQSHYVPQLRIYPHALRDANAYYDPVKKALLFGYFTAAHQSFGANYPGGLVFTCLSPDIVAHETTHAILDAIHHRYMEDTNVDVGAFHEGFADIVALLQRFTFSDLVEHQLYQSAGRLDRYNVFGELATQFGEALAGNRGALRSMIGRWKTSADGEVVWTPLKPSPIDYQRKFEAHDRGAILVATIFDAFQRIYNHKTRDLILIATGGTGVLPEGSISRDLVHRLAREASESAEHLLHICIRALDYCPPHDITFGDYQRALITADLDIAPEDESGYRVALIEAFRARGIYPDRVNSLSIESLRWSRPEFSTPETQIFELLAGAIKADVRELVDTIDRSELDRLSRAVQAKLRTILNSNRDTEHREGWEFFLSKLGLTNEPVDKLFGADGSEVDFILDHKSDRQYVPKIEVHMVRPAFRSGREGRQTEQVLVTLSQRVWVNIGTSERPVEMLFRGGCTLIMSLGLRKVEQVVLKNIKSYRRFRKQVDYVKGDSDSAQPSMSLYAREDRDWSLNFRLLHGRE